MISEFQQTEQRVEQTDFNAQNWVFLRNKEAQTRFTPLSKGSLDSLPEEYRALLEAAADYYRTSNDIFNLCKLEIKRGDIEEAERLAEEFLSQEGREESELAELKKGYLMRELAVVKKDKNLKARAISHFIQYGDLLSDRDDLAGFELSAIAFWAAAKIMKKGKERFLTEKKCIGQYRKMAEDRKAAGDLWWESIALRQIGKISSDPNDKEVAIKRAEEMSDYYKKKGDHKNAALWARDLNDLAPQEKFSLQTKNLWAEHILESAKRTEPREVAKTYWQLAKREDDAVRAKQYRKEAIDWYQTVLEKAKADGNNARIQECCRSFSELIV